MVARTLFTSPAIRISEVTCGAARGGGGGEEYSESSVLGIPLRGCYAIERKREILVADANTAVLFDAGKPYRVAHPADGGDVTLTIAAGGDAFGDAFGASLSPPYLPLDAKTQLAVWDLRAETLSTDPDCFHIEEASLRLLGRLARLPRVNLSMKRERIVNGAKAYLGEHFSERILLGDVAAAAGLSPFLLTRLFSVSTGMTLHRYLVSLRCAAALNAIAAGETDLSRVAVDAGFAHHSHLTKTFRSAFGAPPRSIRRSLQAPEQAYRDW